MTRFNTRFSDGDVTAELYMYDGQRWAVIELHVIQLRNSITNYKCNL